MKNGLGMIWVCLKIVDSPKMGILIGKMMIHQWMERVMGL